MPNCKRRMRSVALVLFCAFTIMAGPAQAESSGTALGRLGWEAIRAGQVMEASRLFHDAIAENAQDSTLFLGAGLAAHLQGHESEARTALEAAVRLNPKLTAASLLLGDISYRRSEEHTSELQSPCNLVCRLLLEKKKKKTIMYTKII